MAMDRFVIALIANTMYEEELAKRLGINTHSEYGRKRLNEYLKAERRDDEVRARWSLEASNPGKFISRYEAQVEAARIREERLKPYIEKAKIIHAKRQQEEKQEQNGPVLSKKVNFTK